MTKEEILHDFEDINFFYNDCGMKDRLSKDLDEFEEEIRADERAKVIAELESHYDYIESAFGPKVYQYCKNNVDWLKEQKNDSSRID